MYRSKLWIVIGTLVLIGLQPSQSLAQKRILILSWNVESGDNDPATIAQQLEDFEGYDMIGLTEVKSENAADYADAAADGEGAKNSAQADFGHVVSNSGAGDRMVIIWDRKRFEKIGDAQELDDLNDGNHRSPLVARFKLKNTDIEFLFMVNHLARKKHQLRQQQAAGLKQWAEGQQLPVIAVGDYNFDYDVDDGEGNQAMDNMLSDDVWQWVRPERLCKTQASKRYNGVLDFIFVANKPDTWSVDSHIISEGFPSTDDSRRSDHRPLEGRVLISD
jgi:exonuclease III